MSALSQPKLDAPYPYFGGKSCCVDIVWQRFGEVRNYVEPFAGSAVMLLRNPRPAPTETINDLDAYVANFWRAVKAEPERIADLIDWPENEADLEARHKWLVTAARKREHYTRMRDEPDYFDAKIAAWWVWGLCCWIGRGWCEGEWHGCGDAETHGTGINVRDETRGGKRPMLHRPRGVHRQLPYLGTGGQGVTRVGRRGALLDWMQALAARLRYVSVCCGDWTRVLGPTPTTYQGLTAVFLDAPYSAEAGRDMNIYAHESGDVAHAVREWAIAHGDDPLMRIALCGYEGEHVMPDTWECVHWKAHGGYGVQQGGGNYTNKYRERIWFSPHCQHPGLF